MTFRIVATVFSALALIGLLFLVMPAATVKVEPGPPVAPVPNFTTPDPEFDANRWHTLTVTHTEQRRYEQVLPKFGFAEAHAAADSQPTGEREALNAVFGLNGIDSVYEVADDPTGELKAGSRVIAVDGQIPTATPSGGTWLLADPSGDLRTVTRESTQGMTWETLRLPNLAANNFTLADTQGSSSGLILALAWLDALTPGDQSHNQTIMGTGKITSQGQILPVDSVETKLHTPEATEADLVLIPTGSAANWPADVNVVEVSTLDEAVAAIRGA